MHIYISGNLIKFLKRGIWRMCLRDWISFTNFFSLISGKSHLGYALSFFSLYLLCRSMLLQFPIVVSCSLLVFLIIITVTYKRKEIKFLLDPKLRDLWKLHLLCRFYRQSITHGYNQQCFGKSANQSSSQPRKESVTADNCKKYYFQKLHFIFQFLKII